MKKILLGALLAAAAATPALAQDNPTFTGAKIEALGGWDKVDSAIDADGFAYGLGVGYDIQTASGLVVGAEAEYMDSTAKKCVDVVADEYCLKAGRDLYVGGRLGTTIGAAKNTLLYVKGGYTDAKGKYEQTLAGVTTSDSATDGGWRVGAGVETQTSNKISLKGEYRYSDYGDDVNRHQIVAGVGIRF